MKGKQSSAANNRAKPKEMASNLALEDEQVTYRVFSTTKKVVKGALSDV